MGGYDLSLFMDFSQVIYSLGPAFLLSMNSTCPLRLNLDENFPLKTFVIL